MATTKPQRKFVSKRVSRIVTRWRSPIDPEAAHRAAEARLASEQTRRAMTRMGGR